MDGFPGPKGRVGHRDLTQNIGQNLQAASTSAQRADADPRLLIRPERAG